MNIQKPSELSLCSLKWEHLEISLLSRNPGGVMGSVDSSTGINSSAPFNLGNILKLALKSYFTSIAAVVV